MPYLCRKYALLLVVAMMATTLAGCGTGGIGTAGTDRQAAWQVPNVGRGYRYPTGLQTAYPELSPYRRLTPSRGAATYSVPH